MNLPEFTSWLTGLSRGLITRKQHPDDIDIRIKYIDAEDNIHDLSVHRLEYKERGEYVDILIVHQV